MELSNPLGSDDGYATYNISSQLFVQKYQLYLPDRESLRRDLAETLREANQ